MISTEEHFLRVRISEPDRHEKTWIIVDHITGALAKWAIRQSPYDCPDDLEDVVKHLDKCMTHELNKIPNEDRTSGMYKVSVAHIRGLLRNILGGYGPFQEWNKCKVGNTPESLFTSRYDSARDPDRDFIDLDALFMNICMELTRD